MHVTMQDLLYGNCNKRLSECGYVWDLIAALSCCVLLILAHPASVVMGCISQMRVPYTVSWFARMHAHLAMTPQT